MFKNTDIQGVYSLNSRTGLEIIPRRNCYEFYITGTDLVDILKQIHIHFLVDYKTNKVTIGNEVIDFEQLETKIGSEFYSKIVKIINADHKILLDFYRIEIPDTAFYTEEEI